MSSPTSLSGHEALMPPPGAAQVPQFDCGWVGDSCDHGAFLAYVDRASVNWSEDLEDLHEESSRDHFLDVWTRRAMLSQLQGPASVQALADVGCSSGYLLEELGAVFPDATLIGVDLIASGLRKAHTLVPQARLVQADACALPLRDESIDAALSANLLEHVPDDVRALAELRRVLRPGGRAVVVVPSGPRLYDYYDRFLGHERRYKRGELARKARGTGLEVLLDTHLGWLLYAPFWIVKKRNRHREPLDGEQLRKRVAGDISNTSNSRVGRFASLLEERVLRAGISVPFGIRGLMVLRRPQEQW